FIDLVQVGTHTHTHTHMRKRTRTRTRTHTHTHIYTHTHTHTHSSAQNICPNTDIIPLQLPVTCPHLLVWCQMRRPSPPLKPARVTTHSLSHTHTHTHTHTGVRRLLSVLGHLCF